MVYGVKPCRKQSRRLALDLLVGNFLRGQRSKDVAVLLNVPALLSAGCAARRRHNFLATISLTMETSAERKRNAPDPASTRAAAFFDASSAPM